MGRLRQRGGATWRAVAARVRAARAFARRRRLLDLGWRAGVFVLGTAVVLTGIVLLPLPGPGWVIIFVGLGLLATEFEWASRLLNRARRGYLALRDRARHRGEASGARGPTADRDPL